MINMAFNSSLSIKSAQNGLMILLGSWRCLLCNYSTSIVCPSNRMLPSAWLSAIMLIILALAIARWRINHRRHSSWERKIQRSSRLTDSARFHRRDIIISNIKITNTALPSVDKINRQCKSLTSAPYFPDRAVNWWPKTEGFAKRVNWARWFTL